MEVLQNLVGMIQIGPDTMGVSSILANEVQKVLKHLQSFSGRMFRVPAGAHAER
jgi:hypothetical protein